MGLDTSFTPRFRQRKISLKQNLRVLWERNLPDNVEDVRGDLLGIVETGVDKSEEDERHLQAVLHSATLAGKRADAYIPTPEATKKFSDYSKFYWPGWVQTESYIRSSATVEDAQGVEYCMDSEDLEFLNKVVNKGISDAKARCSEDEFESLCSLIESVISEKQPFLSTDVTQLMMYPEAEPHIIYKLELRRRKSLNPLDPERLLSEANSPDYAPGLVSSPYRDLLQSVKLFGSTIYSHWRARKIALLGRSVKPSVRFETGLSSDDQDPYVTFRHREVRHTRKTRRTDQQNSGRLRKLHGEMHDAQALFEFILKRERTRLQQIQTDFEIFELRCRTKALKRKLHIDQEPDDLELLVSVSKRVRQEEAAKRHREEADRKRRAQLAADKVEREREKREKRDEHSPAGRSSLTPSAQGAPKSTAGTTPGSRIPLLEHYTIEQQQVDRIMEREDTIAARMQKRKNQNKGWIDVSDSATVPLFDFFSLKDFSGQDPKRVNLPDDMWSNGEDTNFSDSPDVIHVDGKGTADDPYTTQFYSEVDFRRQPTRFSIPNNMPSALLRKRQFGGLTYVDRVIPPAFNSQTMFGQQLREFPESEADERLADRYKFDQELDVFAPPEDLINDPARLNGISPRTQDLRFSSILTGKASDMISDAQTQRRKACNLILQRMQQQQKQQKAALDAQALRAAQNQSAASTNARIQQAQKAAQRQLQRRKAEESQQQSTKPGGKLNAAAGSSAQSNGTKMPFKTPLDTSGLKNSRPGNDKSSSPTKRKGNKDADDLEKGRTDDKKPLSRKSSSSSNTSTTQNGSLGNNGSAKPGASTGTGPNQGGGSEDNKFKAQVPEVEASV